MPTMAIENFLRKALACCNANETMMAPRFSPRWDNLRVPLPAAARSRCPRGHSEREGARLSAGSALSGGRSDDSELSKGEIEPSWRHDEPLGPLVGQHARETMPQQPRRAAEDEHVAALQPHLV